MFDCVLNTFLISFKLQDAEMADMKLRLKLQKECFLGIRQTKAKVTSYQKVAFFGLSLHFKIFIF